MQHAIHRLPKVPYLSVGQIEAATNDLLDDYARGHGVIKPPIPVDAILESHLGLTLDFDDLPKRFGVLPGAIGALDVDQSAAFVSEHLDPYANWPFTAISWETPPNLLTATARCRFTIGHEVGHWVLHRDYVRGDAAERGVLARIICRTEQRREPVEWQADRFSACLLMPSRMVRDAFQHQVGERPLDRFDVHSLAGDFGVSQQAMRIRVRELALGSAPVKKVTAA